MRRPLAFLVALAVVSAMVLGGVAPGGAMVGTASAQTAGFHDCDLGDSIVGAFLQSLTNPSADGKCRFNPDDQTDYQNISTTDAYQQGVSMAGSTDSYLTTRNNFVNDTKAIAVSKAKIEIVNALNAGKSKTTAKANAKEVIDRYYARQQANVRAHYAAQMQQAKYLYQTPVTMENGQGESITGIKNRSASGDTVTLVNGTTVPIWTSTAAAHYPPRLTSDNGNLVFKNSNGDSVEVDIRGLRDHFEQIDTVHGNVRANVDAYVDAVYSGYVQGELNTTDIMDPATLAYEAGTEANSTGYYGYAAAQLGALGMSGEINHSHTVELLSNGSTTQTHTGTLYYSGDDRTEFANGTTYDLANLSGSVYMATSDDDGADIIKLSNRADAFRITEAINTKTGEQVNKTVVEQKTYETYNASRLADELADLRELRESYEQQSSGAAGGSSGSSIPTEAVALIALVVIGAMALRDQGGGKRRR